MKLHRIRPIVKKEFRQIWRDPRSLGVLLVVPSFMLIMFGYALNYDVKDLSLAVLDQDHSVSSRNFAETFLHSEYFEKKFTLVTESQIRPLLDGDQVRAVLVIPIDFGKTLDAGRVARVQVLVDGSNSSIATTAVGYLEAITQDYSTNITLDALAKTGRNRPTLPIDYRPRIWYNPELKSAKFLVPGLIGFILMITTVVSTSLSIVREKERGTIEQIDVSPITSFELITGKVLPYIFISLASTIMILIVGNLLFDVVVRGAYFYLLITTLLFLACGLGLGLWVSTVAKTQESAFQLATLLSFLPTFTLSGFTFPIRNMPVPIQMITYLNPARYFMTTLRMIILKGVGVEDYWQQWVFMLAFAIFIGSISWNRMRKKTLD